MSYLLCPKQGVSCTWPEIAELLLALDAIMIDRYPEYGWYIADCDGFFSNDKFPDGWPYVAEDISKKIANVEQFLSWVFFLAPIAASIDTSTIDTEARSGVQRESALVEIRAFDTSYIEVSHRLKDIDLMPLFGEFSVKWLEEDASDPQ